MRNGTRAVFVRGVQVGGQDRVVVQTMLNANPHDAEAVLAQSTALHTRGADIIRLAVPDERAAEVLAEVRGKTKIPLVADIHFDHMLAIASISAGADKVRINPGNIGSMDKVLAIAEAAKAAKIPLRVGVNLGSLDKQAEREHGRTSAAMVQSALFYIKELESAGFHDIIVALKASDVPTTVRAYREFAAQSDYPLHLGVTEAGTPARGIIKSAVGIGALLLDGIGDTIRVSLSADPLHEITAAKNILRSVGLHNKGVNLISCPSCGRCKHDLIGIAEKVERLLEDIEQPLNVAVMGCVVNGPGEASHADIGIACGASDTATLFAHGKPIKKLSGDIAEQFANEVKKLLR